jgi:hypothetical protein
MCVCGDAWLTMVGIVCAIIVEYAVPETKHSSPRARFVTAYQEVSIVPLLKLHIKEISLGIRRSKDIFLPSSFRRGVEGHGHVSACCEPDSVISALCRQHCS